MTNVIIVLTLFALLAAPYCAHAENLKVSVYYESLCPNSIMFMVTQLKPTYAKIGEHLEVDLVPYGKATHTLENGQWIFQCQHGPSECYGNKMQACAFNQNLSQDAIVEFVACVMGSLNPAGDARLKTCAEKNGFSWEEMKECSDNGLGEELLVAHGDRTHAVEPKITFVPTIIFNDKYNLGVQVTSQFDFFNTACKAMEEKPEACK